MINVFKTHKGNYGRKRIKHALAKKEIVISENKISCIMRKNGLVSKLGRKSKAKKNKSTAAEYLKENLVLKNLLGHAPNELLCADIHEIQYKGSKLYVSGVMDAGTRAIIGWDIQKHQRQEIVHDAIKMAIGRHSETKNKAIFHCDRGCQYTANKTKELLESAKIRISMSRPGTPNDNQLIESFWKTMDTEMDSVAQMNFRDAKKTIIKYIEMYYNSERIHSGINYLTPNEAYTKTA